VKFLISLLIILPQQNSAKWSAEFGKIVRGKLWALVIGGLVDIIVTYLIILHCCHFLLYCFWVLWCACLGI